MPYTISPIRRFFILFSLVFAGEVIFSLPFHIARFFRPVLLDGLNLSNTQLGDAFALYGVMAMLAYFPGGAIADRLSARSLMCVSLLATALGGLYFALLPTPAELMLLFAYWGITTILLFWAAMIKLTRLWGGDNTQGKAFGLLDGGRGLIAALMASIVVWLLTQWGMSAAQTAGPLRPLQWTIGFYTLSTAMGALLIWLAIPHSQHSTSQPLETHSSETAFVWSKLLTLLKQPKIWLQGLVVVCAYCSYKGLDYMGLYATNVLNMTPLESAQLTAQASYLRPVAAIAAGVIADRLGAGKLIVGLFCTLAISLIAYCVLNTGVTTSLISTNILLTFALVFALRGIYFALLKETQVATSYTGTAVGVISAVGFTPDIFVAPIAGRILDQFPGHQGFELLFSTLALICVVGAVCTLLLLKTANRNKAKAKA